MIKKGDFVEVEYTGRVKEGNVVFDSTSAVEAKKAGIYNKKADYKPAVICVGEGHMLQGIDEQLVGKDVGSYEIGIAAEKGFGKKNPGLIQLIPTAKFSKQGFMPQVGMQVSVDNEMGTVRAVTGGRTIVDFNHPLSGRDLSYSVTIKRIVSDAKEKAKAILDVEMRFPESIFAFEGEKLVITAKIPEPVQKIIRDRIAAAAGLKEVEFKEPEKKAAKEGSAAGANAGVKQDAAKPADAKAAAGSPSAAAEGAVKAQKPARQ